MAFDPSVDCSSWYSLYTWHQHEKVIASILANKGFDVFLPLYGTVRRWKDRDKKLMLPLFPCYLFIRGGLDRRLDIVSTPGVCSFVATNGTPAVIPADEIAAIRRVLESPARVDPHPYLQVGDRVRVTSGAFEGLEGILVRTKGDCRLVLSIELLQKSAAVEVDVSAVERVAPAPRLAAESGISRSIL
jgi:transcription antitermination factor NusG